MATYSKDDFARLKGEIIHCWPSRKGNTVVLVYVNEFREKKSLSVRQWYPQADKKFYPGKKGIEIPWSELPEFLRAAKRVRKLLEK